MPPPFCEKRWQYLQGSQKGMPLRVDLLRTATEMNRPEPGSTNIATVIVHPPPKTCRVKHSTQMFGYSNVAGSIRGTYTMRKIIGPAVIVLTLAGCAMGGDLPGTAPGAETI